MCGINGFNFKDINILQEMNNTIKHRGPDDAGMFSDFLCSLGHVRLSILDLSVAGHQPLFYDKKKGASNELFNKENVMDSYVSVVFNGEIYNYLELREELEKYGFIFSTKTDTEVILAAYIKWGEKCVEKFNGMWAFCIYDRKKEVLFLSRDRFGVKPLYYYDNNGKFIFSSEMKGILSHKSLGINKSENISEEAVGFFFSAGFIPSPFSIFKNTFKLEPSTNIIYNLKKAKIESKYKYYELPIFNPQNNKKDLVREGKDLFLDSTKLRMRSDVDVGAFLSGGLDSSSTLAIMKELTDIEKIHTFSVGFEGKKFDETKYIKIMQEEIKSKNHHKYFFKKDFQNMLDKFTWIYDEPFADYSGFPTYFVSKMAKENGVKVVLSGDGGDEIFGGYTLHLTGARIDLIGKVPAILRMGLAKVPVKKNLTNSSLYMLKQAIGISLDEPANFFKNTMKNERIKTPEYVEWTYNGINNACKNVGEKSFAEAFRIYDTLYNTLADKILLKVDKASMAASIEVRAPLLDYRFFEFSQRIPTKYKVNGFDGKILMKDIIKDLVPDEIINRPKKGFSPPIKDWLGDDAIDVKKLRNKLYEMNKKNVISDYIRDYYVEKYFEDDNNIYRDYIIRLFIFVEWYEMWVR